MALDEQVKSSWNKSMHVKDLGDVANNMDKLMKSLHGWSRDHIGYLPKNLESARQRLNVLFKRNYLSANMERNKSMGRWMSSCPRKKSCGSRDLVSTK